MHPVSRPVAMGVTIAVIALGLVGILLSVQLEVGTPARPGPGFWPLVAACVVTGCAVLLLVTERSTKDYERFGSEAMPVAGAVASLAAFAVLLETIGMLLATGLLMLFWLRVLGRQTWLVSIAVAAAGPMVAYLLFVVALGVPLPVWPG
ncbi:tripartite tricarboxylate transporter TctB family protein [Pseudonocardia nigra]|uniref:tripartite tricarboxylate transporter TctB family protein n=1 Tax=Pseudonocardia nigra TaxID=1921578 RepID=UPI001C5E58F9|nr:tripartite tricarboxylate transporter TctB family protein [Pseudonocardia nigra]